MTLIEMIYDKLNTMSDADFKSWMLNTDLVKAEKSMIIQAFKMGYKECELDNGRIPEAYEDYKPNDGTERFLQTELFI
tara:strand:+ start:4264 stop:4497 length:234 start_codon:yes stop_codon:yes gene_type:complete